MSGSDLFWFLNVKKKLDLKMIVDRELNEIRNSLAYSGHGSWLEQDS